jgi:phosphate transport system substrate-binding protein
MGRPLARGLTSLTTLALFVGTTSAAAEVTMRMKGGDIAIIGEVKSFDGVRYTIMSKTFGEMSLGSRRFDCIGAQCPTTVTTAPMQAAFTTLMPTMALSIAGSSTIGDQLMPGLINGFAEQNKLSVTRLPGAAQRDSQFKLDFGNRTVAVIDLQRDGANAAFKGLETRPSMIGMSSRSIRTDEADKLAAAGLGNVRGLDSEHVVGLDGLQVLVSPDNKLSSIAIEDLARVYAGQITDWSELGGVPGRINVYAPVAESDTFESFDQTVLQPRRIELPRTVKRVPDHAEQVDLITRDPNGIGFASASYQRNAKPLNLRLSCGLVSTPSSFNIKTEEYPLARRLYLYAPSSQSMPLAQSLLSFALSPAGQAIVKQNDFTDLSPELISHETQVNRIANSLNAPAEQFNATLLHDLVQEVKSGKRLSLTFRFQRNSFRLDNKALADIARLKAALQSPEFKSATVSLLGFADPRGNFGENTLLSERRAKAVHTALSIDGTVSTRNMRVKGYGSLAPVACSDDDNGRNLNRRVEVWIKQ